LDEYQLIYEVTSGLVMYTVFVAGYVDFKVVLLKHRPHHSHRDIQASLRTVSRWGRILKIPVLYTVPPKGNKERNIGVLCSQ